jgi:hypothetical protein
MKVKLPQAILDQMRKAGQARAAQMTTADREKYGRKGWQTRLTNARKVKP